MRKIISMFLAALMVVSIFALVSCGNSETDATTTPATTTASTSATTSKVEESTTVATTEKTEPDVPGYGKLEGYYDVDFNDFTFRFVSTSDWVDEVGRWCNTKEIAVESRDGGTIIDTAVYDRNAVMKKLYNCNISVLEGNANELISADVLTNNNTYDFGSIQSGFFKTDKTNIWTNMYDLNLDFSLDGWNTDWINQVTVKDNNGVKKLFSIDADFNLVGYRAIWTLCMNLDLYNQNFSESIFDLVAEKKWTIDKMIEVCTMVAQDNGDQEWKVGDDTFGLLTTSHNVFGMIASTGIRLVQNNDGEIKTSKDIIMANNAVAAVDKMIELYAVDGVKADNGYTSNQTELEGGRTLFIGEVFDILERMKDSENINVVCVPEPLYSSEQDAYYSNVNSKVSVWCVSKNACGGDTEMVSDFLNLLTWHSNKIVYPAFVATYGGVYCQDARAAELVETIMAHRVYDIGYMPAQVYGLIGTLVGDGNNNYATAANAWAKKNLGTAITTLLDDLTKSGT